MRYDRRYRMKCNRRHGIGCDSGHGKGSGRNPKFGEVIKNITNNTSIALIFITFHTNFSPIIHPD